jgi:hypothetical protein
MPYPSHPPWLDHSVWLGVQVMKLLIIQFSPTSRHFISLRTKYSTIKIPTLIKTCSGIQMLMGGAGGGYTDIEIA